MVSFRSTRTLSELFQREKSLIGLKENAMGSTSKKIRSPGKRAERFVPGYTIDYEYPGDATVKRFEYKKMAKSNWNNEIITREVVRVPIMAKAVARINLKTGIATDKT